MSHTPALPQPGATLAGRYVLGRPLGKGAMGVVYDGELTRLEQRVAIKVLRPEILSEPGLVERFDREARLVAKMKSEHVVRVLDVDATADGLPFLVMEKLDGHDLGSELRSRGRLPVGEAVEYVRQICSGMAEAHRAGIIHRDLKPSNIFLVRREGGLDPNERLVKILDFGVSKILGDANLTATESTLGTPRYMSPEQIRSAKSVDERTDVWSVAVILFELLTGKTPFAGESATGMAAAIVVDAPLTVRSLRPDVPEALERVLSAGLAKNPAERIQTVLALRDALDPFAAAPRASLVAAHERPSLPGHGIPSPSPSSPGSAPGSLSRATAGSFSGGVGASTGGSLSGGPFASGQSASGQSASGQPATGQPATGHSAGAQSAGGSSASGQSAFGSFGAGPSAGGPSAGGPSAGGPSSGPSASTSQSGASSFGVPGPGASTPPSTSVPPGPTQASWAQAPRVGAQPLPMRTIVTLFVVLFTGIAAALTVGLVLTRRPTTPTAAAGTTVALASTQGAPTVVDHVKTDDHAAAPTGDPTATASTSSAAPRGDQTAAPIPSPTPTVAPSAKPASPTGSAHPLAGTMPSAKAPVAKDCPASEKILVGSKLVCP